MGRPLRDDVAGRWYHVVNRGVNRSTIFHDDRDRVEFERLLGVAHTRFGVTVHAYCWMTNHYHLVMECPDGGLSDVMHLVGSVYVRHVNERQQRDGPLFRARFYAKPVQSEGYLLRLVRYIHRNPLAFLPAERLAAYRWSSLRTYLGHRREPTWMDTHAVLAACGGRERLVQLVIDHERPPVPPVDAPAWLGAVELAIDEAGLGDGRSRPGRAVAALLLDRLEGADREAVAKVLAYPSRDAEYAARSRARRQLRDNPELGAIVDAVISIAA